MYRLIIQEVINMPKIDAEEEGTLRPIIISGNHLDLLLYKMHQEDEAFDYYLVELENRASDDIDSLIDDPSNDWDNVKDVYDHIKSGQRYLSIRYSMRQQIEDAIEKDRSSELRIIYKD